MNVSLVDRFLNDSFRYKANFVFPVFLTVLAVKYINRSEKENCIKLVSYNIHHEPMDLSLDRINAMALVKFSTRKNLIT